jgi:glutamate dehydrogenase
MAALQKAIAQLMEGRQERSEERTDPPKLAQLLAELRVRLEPADRLAGEAFTRELVGKADALLTESSDMTQLAGMAGSAFAFLRQRGAAPLAVRIFTPQQDRDGWSSPLTVVETVLDDRPFIVDTLYHTITAAGGDIRVLLHPVLGVERGAEGSLQRVGSAESAPTRESLFHAEVANLPPGAALQQQLADRLRQLVLATGDYHIMRERTAGVAAELRAHAPLAGRWEDDRDELAAFLDWLGHKSFVYLGYREYDLRGNGGNRVAVVRPGRGLGILRDDAQSRYAVPRNVPAELTRRLDAPRLWLVSKTNALSPIHRAVAMDDIAVKDVDANGAVIGIRRLLGLFTAKGYSDPPSGIPILRQRLAEILARERVVADSHDYRDLVALFDSLPREQMLASDRDDVHRLMNAVRAVDAHAGIQLICRPDALSRGLLADVLVPRARFSTELHGQVSAAVRRHLRAAMLHEHLALDERPVARLHYYCAVPLEVLERPPIDALRAELSALLRTWDDALREVLARSGARTDADRLATRYARVLPPAYKAGTAVAEAAQDVRCLEALCATGRVQIEVVGAKRPAASHALKLYLANQPLVLSDFVPVLEHLGLRVLGENVVDLQLPEIGAAYIHTFAVQSAQGTDLEHAAPRLIAALQALRDGTLESDHLNALVLAAGLDWRAVDLLRAYVEHARQVGLASPQSLIEALTANPVSAACLFEYFAAKFDPAAPPGSADDRLAGPVGEARSHFLASLEAVQSLAHDRVLRGLGEAVGATVRTNFYAAAEGGAIALKLDCAQLAHLPEPRPAIETWVHAPQLCGIHLRAGRVARGGIRASDRPDDFRAEILGLMRTQVVKNAVIVPVGAKGGFVVKGVPIGVRIDAARTEAAYRSFIAALLSITDNRESGEIVSPPGQIVYDAPDPYLVVAADKGTATFSDLANEIAAEHRFWLGDAFASGGRHGYDHKRLAITARGVWECARQHFRDMGRDLERETVTVAGIGDMSGDVFGNGLLRSRRLRLLAAFNHRDIFLDPDPDPELSYQERARLFHLHGSGWTDYAPTSLSRGGGVYPRQAKSIALSPEARSLLGQGASAASGEDVVRAILRLPVDLLWNGGIGTYVKASDERHVDVADPGNDAVRIDARELRAAVVAEGGNLGLTQRARIEYALAGGRINSDAIDNSGGVDLSDHEVNLKIALQPLVDEGTLAAEARNALLAELADPVCNAVLSHNRSQALALGIDQARSRTQLAAFCDLIAILEAEAGLNRQLAQLPTREALRARRGVYRGLTRPELAVLMAHTKLDLQRRILHSPWGDDPELEGYLRGYFPGAVSERFATVLHRHPLRREIISVGLANDLVDTMGLTFLVRAVRDTGRDVLDVVRGWTAACAITDVAALRAQLTAARERLAAESVQRITLGLAAALERAALWLVQSQLSGHPLSELIERFRHPITELLAAPPDLLPPQRRRVHAAAISALVDAGLDASLAERLVQLSHADAALEVAHLAHTAGVPAPRAAEAYAATTALVDFEWLREVVPETLPGEDGWEPRAAASLLEVVLDMRRQLSLHVLARCRDGLPISEGVQAFAANCRDQLDTVNGLIGDIKAAPHPTLPGLVVVMREIGRLARPQR